MTIVLIPWFGNGFYFLPSTSRFLESVLEILALKTEPLKEMSLGVNNVLKWNLSTCGERNSSGGWKTKKGRKLRFKYIFYKDKNGSMIKLQK